MPNNSAAPRSTGNNSDGEFESQSDGKSRDGSRRQAEGSTKGNKCTVDDDDITAGGREGQFSETDRDNDREWSPGSSPPSEG